MFGDHQTNRRRVLKTFGGTGIGALALVGTGFSSASADTADGGAPAVEWRHSYEGGETEYTDLVLLDLFQTEDGGYAMPGRGRPVTKTGPGRGQFALLRADSQGERQWISFAEIPSPIADDLWFGYPGEGDSEDMELDLFGFLQTQDGGYVFAGNISWSSDEHHVDEDEVRRPAGAVAKYSPDGDFEWFTVIEKGVDEPHEDGTLQAVAESSTGDGFVVAGRWHDDEENTFSPWLVKFGSDGSIQWERTYDDLAVQTERGFPGFDYAFTRDGGYTLIGLDQPRRYVVVSVDENGNVEDVAEGELGFSDDRGIEDIISTSDGGFAFAGYDRIGDADMWLAKLDADLNLQWSKTYDGPYEGGDVARVVIQTADGGYALGGRMEAAYTGTDKPTVVKTDAEGNEEWEKLLEMDSFRIDEFIQTDDAGYGLVGTNTVREEDDPTRFEETLVKLGPSGSGNQDDETTLSPIGDFDNPPTDPDGDGKFEDVNGDGEFDIVDVQALFANRTDPTIQNNPEKFDFNGDGVFDVVDVQALFTELTEEN